MSIACVRGVRRFSGAFEFTKRESKQAESSRGRWVRWPAAIQVRPIQSVLRDPCPGGGLAPTWQISVNPSESNLIQLGRLFETSKDKAVGGNPISLFPLRPVSIALFILLALSFSQLSRAEDNPWKIIPGVSLGQVKIGMERAEVFRLLGTPHLEQDLETVEPKGHLMTNADPNIPLKPLKGVIQDDWITPLAVPKENESTTTFMADFVTVYFLDGKVAQIEARVARFQTAEGLSFKSTARDFRKKYPAYTTTSALYAHPSSVGWPAYKHYMVFEDAVKAGLAWRYGAMGNLAPDPQPDDELETIIVHAPGHPLLIDPDGGARFIWKDLPFKRK